LAQVWQLVRKVLTQSFRRVVPSVIEAQ